MAIFGFVSRINTNSKSKSKKHHTTTNFTTVQRMYRLYRHRATIGDRQMAISPFSMFSDGRPSVKLVTRQST